MSKTLTLTLGIYFTYVTRPSLVGISTTIANVHLLVLHTNTLQHTIQQKTLAVKNFGE